MQRWLFFIFSLFCGWHSVAQKVDIERTSLSLWLNQLDTSSGTVHAQCQLDISFDLPPDSLYLLSKDLKFNYVKIQEGRLKANLNTRQTGDTLWIKFVDQLTSPIRISFDYEISLSSQGVQLNPDFVAFNGSNLESSFAPTEYHSSGHLQ